MYGIFFIQCVYNKIKYLFIYVLCYCSVSLFQIVTRSRSRLECLIIIQQIPQKILRIRLFFFNSKQMHIHNILINSIKVFIIQIFNMYSDQEIEDDEPMMLGDDDEEPTNIRQNSTYIYPNPYKIIEGKQVYDQLELHLEQINQRIAKGKDWALIFYRYYNWNLEKCQSDYFFHEADVLKSTWYTPEPFKILEIKDKCNVCAMVTKKFISNICGHRFCWDCWKDYICNNIGIKVVFFRCMQDGCKHPVLNSMIKKVLQISPSITQKYEKYLTENFVQTNPNIKFCPGNDCKYCIQTDNKILKYVQCKCGQKFCFKCKGEVHRPCDCKQVKQWKNIVQKQEANAKWLNLNTKICPFCNKHVQRSTGCNFMNCAPPGGCGKSFCYVCSRPWQPDHRDHFKCNVYKPAQSQQLQKEKQKSILAKINFYCEKYLTNQQAKLKLKILWQKSGESQIELFNLLGIQLAQSQFIVNAYKCVMQACDILKWSYAFSFFLNDHMKKAKDLFEFKQGQFERYKQNLTFKLETKLKAFIEKVNKDYKAKTLSNKQEYIKEFYVIKEEIITYYKYAQQFMHQLIDMVQNGEIYL